MLTSLQVFLSPFTQSIPARIIAADRQREPNPDCPVCSVFQTSAYVDLSRATLKDLVDDLLRMQLGFGDKEFAVSTEAGILYDPDETENLPKKLSELGMLFCHYHMCYMCANVLQASSSIPSLLSPMRTTQSPSSTSS